MLIKLQTTFKSKAILIVMFSSGIFIMICTVLRAYYSLGDITNLPTALRWADRECCAAAIIASLPGIKPIFRNVRWLSSTNQQVSTTPAQNDYGSRASGKTRFVVVSPPGSSGTELGSMPRDTGKEDSFSRDGSQENILESVDDKTAAVSPTTLAYKQRAIHVTTETKVESQPATEYCCPRYYDV